MAMSSEASKDPAAINIDMKADMKADEIKAISDLPDWFGKLSTFVSTLNKPTPPLSLFFY